MNYILSPELHRNLWLRFSFLKIITVPLFLLITVMITHNVDKDGGHALQSAATTIFYLVIFVWGNYEAGNALQEEVKGGTWDQQKMSAITPLQLGLGKLFGATSYVWYAGLSTLCVLCYAYIGGMQDSSHLFFLLFSLVLSGVFGHAVAFLASLADLSSAARRNIRNYVPAAKGPFIMGLLTSWTVNQQLNAGSSLFGGFIQALATTSREIKWFSLPFTAQDFWLTTSLFFCGWSLVGVYRQTRAELMYRTTPIVWLAFVASVAAYVSGFVGNADIRIHYPAISVVLFAVFLSFTYLAMLPESVDMRKYGRLLHALRTKKWKDAFSETPKWVATLPFTLLLYIVTLDFYATRGGGSNNILPVFTFTTGALLFSARDCIVNHAIALGSAGGRGIRFQRIFYYALAYMLLPMLHWTAFFHGLGLKDVFEFPGGNPTPGVRLSSLYALSTYYPVFSTTYPVAALLPATVETALAAYWLTTKLKPRAK